jgi:hypothetical protein
LNPAIQNLIVYGGLLLITWKPLLGLFGMLGSTIISLATMPFRLLYNTVVGTWSVLKTMAGWTKTAFSAIGTGVYYGIGVPLNWLGERLADLMTVAVRVVNWLERAWSAAVNYFGIAADLTARIILMGTTIITSVVAGLFTWIFILPPLLALITTALAGLTSVVVTLGIGVYQLVGFVGTGLVNAWNAMRDNARVGLEWIGNKVIEITDSVSSMWQMLKDGSLGFLRTAKATMETVAGLFWNFQHNFRVIMEFIEEHGTQVFADLAWASMEMVEAIVGNIGQLAYALGSSLLSVFGAMWDNVKGVSLTFFNWFKGQWRNMFADVNTLIFKFVENLAKNWGAFEKLFKGLRDIELERMAMKWTAPSGVVEDPKAMAERRAKLFKEAFSGLKGPFDELDTGELKTDFSLLGENLTDKIANSGNAWRIAGNEIAKAFGDAFKRMNPILEAFMELPYMPGWDTFLAELNLGLPTFTEAGDLLNKTLGLGEMGNEGLGKAIGGGGGPGFTFKQGSMERFMYDGATNEKIQYQMLHLTQGIRKDVAIIAAQHGNSATPRPTTWRPPLVAPWHPPLVLE